jgi:putative flippase GtrA
MNLPSLPVLGSSPLVDVTSSDSDANRTALCALIPAYRPGGTFPLLIKAIVEAGCFDGVTVVDDGSGPEYQALFAEISQLPSVTVLRHAINLGKGAGLKTGMNQILLQFDSLIGAVTADADGQHSPQDIARVAQSLRQHPNHLILGCRQFTGDIPFRSRFGNVLTKGIFAAVVGRRVSDTQTGLRGIPAKLMRELFPIKSNRYEFEMDMLILAARYNVPFFEEKIETIYIEGNQSSHFRPLLDSTRIYFSLLRFAFSSSVCALIDMALFAIILAATGSILAAQGFARLVSACVNFFLVRDVVFDARSQKFSPALKYAVVALLSGSFSYFAQIALLAEFSIFPLAAKILVETAMFFANFAILRSYVFVTSFGDAEAGQLQE